MPVVAASPAVGSFAALELDQPMLDNLAQLGYHTMTPIQARALPFMLTGKDVMGQASTGTGKTAAFGLAVLSRTTPGQRHPQALVLCPTRELASQVADEIGRLARPIQRLRITTLCGGSPFGRQRDALQRGADVVVGTPGRVLDHIRRGSIKLDHIETLVLDEADRMLDMGFIDDVTTICEATPKTRQTLLFTATLTRAVKVISGRLQSQPATVVVQPEKREGKITQLVYGLGKLTRQQALIRVLGHYQPAQAVIFCGQRATCDTLVESLGQAGYAAAALHGGMEQRERELVLMRFASGAVRWLIATDVAARGIDIPDLPAVINYELPNCADTYTHRIGRTGRAGRDGLAISLVEPRRERRLMALAMPHLKITDPTMAGALPVNKELPAPAPRATVEIDVGLRKKLREDELRTALMEQLGLTADHLGPITVLPYNTFVTVARDLAPRVVAELPGAQIRKVKLRARQID
jgi:ATP-independent RNA helicase DbpA